MVNWKPGNSLVSKDIKGYLKTETKKVLLDVRTQEEWNQFGKPDTVPKTYSNMTTKA